jgi:hypothetical protein
MGQWSRNMKSFKKRNREELCLERMVRETVEVYTELLGISHAE